MHFLRKNTATRISVGPFLDKTDGITPEVALTATNEKLTFVVDVASSGSSTPTLVIDANATASGGNNDFVHISGDDSGYYDLELTAAQTNYIGCARLSVTYATDHLPVFHEYVILPAVVYDSLIDGSDYLQVDAIQWVSGAIPAPNTTGVPKSDALYLNGSSANLLNLNASASTIVRGTVSTGSFSATATEFESADITTATASFYVGRLIVFTTGSLANQACRISAYSKVGSNGHFTVTSLTGAPSNADTFVIV